MCVGCFRCEGRYLKAGGQPVWNAFQLTLLFECLGKFLEAFNDHEVGLVACGSVMKKVYGKRNILFNEKLFPQGFLCGVAGILSMFQLCFIQVKYGLIFAI